MENSNIQQRIILITGGAGFIGSNFIEYLLKKYENYKIINFDKLTYAGNVNNLFFTAEHPNYTFYRGDITVEKDVENVFEQFNPEIVINFAAETHVDRSIVNPDKFLRTNILGTQKLINQAQENEIERFIQISTDEVYGSVKPSALCTESSPLRPVNPYSVSKAAADNCIIAAQNTYGLPINIVRSSNNFGPYQFPEKFIPLIINNLLQKEKIPIYGDGKSIRNWLFVKDFCRALDLVMHKAEAGEIYNVASDDFIENINLVKIILEKTENDEQFINFVKERPGHDHCYSISYKKIKKELGWKPKMDFLTGLEQTIIWYQNHQNWLQEINSGFYQKMNEEITKNNLLES